MSKCGCDNRPARNCCPPPQRRGCGGCLTYLLAGLAVLLFICLISSPLLLL